MVCSRQSVVAMLGLVVAFAVGGCDAEPDGDPGADFVAVLPDAALLLADGPLVEGSTGPDINAIIGDRSGILTTASRSLREANSSLTRTLRTLRVVTTTTAPTITDGARAVWQGQPDDEADAYTLIVERVGESYEFSVYTRGDELGSPWRDRIFGVVVPGARGASRGAMWSDLENDRFDDTEGKQMTLWAGRRGARREVTVVKFDEDDDGEDQVTWTVRFERNDTGAGSMSVGPFWTNLTPNNPDRSAEERLTTVVRWQSGGEGRGDSWARGGDIERSGVAAQVRSECFSGTGDIVYELSQQRAAGQEPQVLKQAGDASACVFPTVGSSDPGYQGDAPTAPARPAELE